MVGGVSEKSHRQRTRATVRASTSDELEARLSSYFSELSDSELSSRAAAALPVPLGAEPIASQPAESSPPAVMPRSRYFRA